MHSRQTSCARTLTYVRVYEAARGGYADALLSETGQKRTGNMGWHGGGKKMREEGWGEIPVGTHTHTHTIQSSQLIVTAEITLYLWEHELCDRKSLLEIWIWVDHCDCWSHTVKTRVTKSTSCIPHFWRSLHKNLSQHEKNYSWYKWIPVHSHQQIWVREIYNTNSSLTYICGLMGITCWTVYCLVAILESLLAACFWKELLLSDINPKSFL